MGTLTAGQIKKFIQIFEDAPSEQVQKIFEYGFLTVLRDLNLDDPNHDKRRPVCGFKSIYSPILELVGKAIIPARGKFVSKKKFVTNRSKSGVKISYLWNNFKEFLLNKVEEPVSKMTLCCAKITLPADDKDIYREIGAEFVETTLSQIWFLLGCQPNGESGLLSTKYTNIFYIRDTKDLCAITINWSQERSIDGWIVGINETVISPNKWITDNRIFSRSK